MEINWAYIVTVAGAGAVTTLFVQLVKSIADVEINKWWLRLLTYVFGSGLMILGRYFIDGFLSAGTLLLSLVNGMLVYFVATGEYHTVLKEITGKLEGGGDGR